MIRHEARGGLADGLTPGRTIVTGLEGGNPELVTQLDDASRVAEFESGQPVKFRAFADNVLVRLLPLPTMSAGGIHTPTSDKRRVHESREAIVVASGPGYYNKSGHLVPNEVKAGDRVLVPAQAGDIWHSALSAPRFNKTAEFKDLMGEEGEFRCVREQEILCVLEAAE